MLLFFFFISTQPAYSSEKTNSEIRQSLSQYLATQADRVNFQVAFLSQTQSLEEIAEQIASKIPMTRQEFNTLAMPTQTEK